MSNVFFCATDFYLKGGYGSYRDFYRLVELSGYPMIPLSQLDPESNNTYIVTPLNNEWMTGWQNPRARIIHYELEWRWDWRANVDTPRGVAETWTGDKWFAECIGARYIPLGSHPGLNVYPELPKVSTYARYDAAFMGYRDPARRARLLDQMDREGLKIAPDGWGQTRSAALLDSRCMVAIHQLDNMPAIAPLRMCIAAAHKLAVISEKVNDAGMFADLLYQAPYADFVRYAKMIIRDPHNNLAQVGEALYQKLCVDMPFRKSIEAAI